MFKENTDHLQESLFSAETMLSEKKRQRLRDSEEHHFYQLIFCHLREEDFSCLYSEKYSRPNASINTMVSGLLLMHRKGWTYEELFRQMDFNLLVRCALGLRDLEETPFSPATLFNFQNRLAEHFVRTGENLLERVFDHLTREQVKALQLKTNIQRTDSFFAASNIRNFSRLQLLIELVIRVHRVLCDEDKERFAAEAGAYLKQTSGQYIYGLSKDEIPRELQSLGQLYHWIATHLAPDYEDLEIFRTFQRVYTEHFSVVEDKVAVVPAEQLSSDSVQSPDDLDATYRNKRTKTCRGQAINVTETCHPQNPLNLITDLAVNPANKNESDMLAERLEKMHEKTPELEELHMDGAYGNEKSDFLMVGHSITPIQTGIKGPAPGVQIEITEENRGSYQVRCPRQSVRSSRTRTRHKAVFDTALCATCPLARRCGTFRKKHGRVFYFTHATYLAQKRHANLRALPQSRQKLRANIEATVAEFTRKMPRGKLKVRGAFNAALFAYAMGISINFGRIVRYCTRTLPGKATLLRNLSRFCDHSPIQKPLLRATITTWRCGYSFLRTTFRKIFQQSSYLSPNLNQIHISLAILKRGFLERTQDYFAPFRAGGGR